MSIAMRGSGTQVQRTRLSDQVADALKDRLLAASLPAGTRLPTEAELVEEFGVSRTVVREAGRILVEWGLVDIRPGRGMVVADFDGSSLARQYELMVSLNPGSFADLMELRQAVEVTVARLAAQRRTEGDIARLREALRVFESPTSEESEQIAADMQFHHALAVATQNPFFVRASGPINASLERTYQSSLGYEEAVAHTIDEHRAIADAVFDGDADAAAGAMRDHLDRVADHSEELARPDDSDPE